MKWAVFSRAMMEQYLNKDHIETFAIISINSTDEHLLFSELEIPDESVLLSLRFDDITENTYTYNEMMQECPEYVSSHSLKLMNQSDARAIVDFTNAIWGRVDKFIVHCDAGVSRSAGVMAAILKYKTGNDGEVFNSKIYYPNMWCYKLVLNEFYRKKLENEQEAVD